MLASVLLSYNLARTTPSYLNQEILLLSSRALPEIYKILTVRSLIRDERQFRTLFVYLAKTFCIHFMIFVTLLFMNW